MTEDVVLVEKKDRVFLLTVNREAALNALNYRIMARLEEIFESLEADRETLVVIITGSGRKAFVAGADVREIKEAGKGRTAFITKGQQILSKIRKSNKVVIAAVNGYALGGGCELALACDFRLASENAKFGLPEAGLGVMAGYGGTQLLPRLIGPGRAKYLMLSGTMLTAGEALTFGLVEKVCSSDALLEEAKSLAEKIASSGPLAIQGTKRAIDAGLELPVDEALRLELEIYDKVANSQDAENGLSAFMEKRKPLFRGE
jgi:enoyl-CoA hydratase